MDRDRLVRIGEENSQLRLNLHTAKNTVARPSKESQAVLKRP